MCKVDLFAEWQQFWPDALPNQLITDNITLHVYTRNDAFYCTTGQTGSQRLQPTATHSLAM